MTPDEYDATPPGKAPKTFIKFMIIGDR